MSSISLSTALSGISAANERLRASASNVAGLASASPRRLQVELASLEGGGVQAGTRVVARPTEPVRELVEQRSATYAFVANMKVLQTQLRPEGALLDIKA